MNLPKYSKGFTLLELLISISIIAIISAGVIPTFSGYIKNQNLKQAQEQLKSDLRSVQNRALTGSLSDQFLDSNRTAYWGIMFTNNSGSYTYFVSANDTLCPPSVKLDQGGATLPNEIKYVGTTGCYFFSIKNGDISKYPTTLPNQIDLKYAISDESVKSVLFNSAGLIYTVN